MKATTSVFFAAALLGSLLTLSLQINAQTTRDYSLSTAVAIFEYMRGDQAAALAEIPISNSVQFQEQKGLSRKLSRVKKIQKSFELDLSGKLPDALHDAIWLDIFKLHNEEGACYKALNDLGKLKDIESGNHDTRLMRVTCILSSTDITADLIVDVEKIALATKGRSINLAYMYSNIASTAHNNKDYSQAQRYYNKALSFLGGDKEAVSLRARIRLSLAWSYYEALLYDQALQQFSMLRLDNEWLDSSLLGYGWAAFKSGDSGLAVESWRQLIYLPYKSISVYESYLSIPYAFESQNAYAEALSAYEEASALYVSEIEEIEALSVTITAKDIRDHVIEYAKSEGRVITPLHPLLVEPFAFGDFQDVFDLNAELNAYKEKVDRFELTVNVLNEARLSTIAQGSKSKAQLLTGEQAVEEKMEQLRLKLDSLAEQLLASGMRASAVYKPLKVQYQHYLLLMKMLSESDANDKAVLHKKIKKMRSVLIGELDEWMLGQGREGLLADARLIKLTESYHLIERRYQDYWSMKKLARKENVGEKQLQVMRDRLLGARENIVSLQNNLDELLLIKTRKALAKGKERLEDYVNQARIGEARLSEEFYQQGGRKLWH